MAKDRPNTDPLGLKLQGIRAMIHEGQLVRAAKALNAAQQAQPQDPRIPLLGMRLAERVGNSQDAVTAARRALQLAPGWHVAQIELARVLTRLQKHDEAMQLAMQAVANNADEPQVMAGAINVARYAGRTEQAIQWAEDTLRRFPDDGGIRIFLARYLQSLHRYDEARAHYQYLHEQLPTHQESLQGLIACALRQEQSDEAQKWADELLALDADNDVCQYWHALAYGKTPATQPAQIVRELFDNQAARFDIHLVRELQYQAPERIAEILKQSFPSLEFGLLDLGCGTGLVGLHLGRIQGHIIGVDLSQAMIDQAAQHQLYSKFYRTNILDAVRETPAAHYEAITCADTLTYVGAAQPVIEGAQRILKPGGIFIFTCEAAQEDEAELVLRDTGRYAHKAPHIRNLCEAAGFADIQIEELPQLRLEAGQPVAGFLVTARKAA